MSTKRDLVEAHSFSRRRLVTAFVSGAPGGREVEPNRPGRMVVGGVGLAVLMVAAGAVLGVVKPRTPDNWLEEDGLVIAKENGASYVVQEGKLYEVENATSAQLIFGAGLSIREVPRDDIDAETIVGLLGIYDAPKSPPGPSRLVDSGWSACTADGATTLLLDDESHVDAAEESAAAVVEAGGATWLLAAHEGAVHRYAMPAGDGPVTALLNELEIGLLSPIPVDARWLNLVPEGAPLSLASFGLSQGQGELLVKDGDAYLHNGTGPIPLTPFSEAVYRGLARVQPREVDQITERLVPGPEDWPETEPTPIGEGDLCAVLHTEPGAAATVSLATAEEGSDAQGDPERSAWVTAGHGAYVRAADHGSPTGGQQFLVDAAGVRYKLGGHGTESAQALGYDPDDAPTVPSFWLEFFACGPELSQAAALETPDPGSTGTCDVR